MTVAKYVVFFTVLIIPEFWWRLAETTLLIELNYLVVLLSHCHYRVMIVLRQVSRKQQHIGGTPIG